MKTYGTMHVPTASSISYAIEALAESVPRGTRDLELVLNLERQTLAVIGKDPETVWHEREKQQAITAPLTATRRGQAWRDGFHREQRNRFGEQSRISLRRSDAEALQLEMLRRMHEDEMDRFAFDQRESAAAHPPATAAPAPLPQAGEVLRPHGTTITPRLARSLLAWFGFPV
jgi:hypothetical protein